jgi:hypothetical protein
MVSRSGKLWCWRHMARFAPRSTSQALIVPAEFRLAGRANTRQLALAAHSQIRRHFPQKTT